MATEKRISEQGTVFDVAIVRDFLQAALNHNAVIDKVDELLFEHAIYGRFHPSVITANLRPIITEVLDTATPEDWQYVAGKLTEEARETLGIDPEGKPSRRIAQKGDPGELREKLAEIYAREHASLIAACHARWIVWRISQLTGISREQIRTDAKADAQAIQTADDYATDQSSEQDSPPVIRGDVTVTVTCGVAAELISQADIRSHDGDSWRLRDGTATTDPRRALTEALVVLAEEDRES